MTHVKVIASDSFISVLPVAFYGQVIYLTDLGPSQNAADLTQSSIKKRNDGTKFLLTSSVVKPSALTPTDIT